MQEYWVNVYRYEGFKDYIHVCNSDELSKRDLKNHINTRRYCLYRIHVKMKPVKPKYDDISMRKLTVYKPNHDLSLSSLINDNSFKNRNLLRQAEDRFGVLDYH